MLTTMAAPTTPTNDRPSSAVQLTILIAVTWLLLNAMFYFLSGYYYDEKRATGGLLSTITDDTVRGTRIAFAICTSIIGATAVAAVFQPRLVTHAIAMLAGLASIVAAGFAFQKGMVPTFPVSLVVIGLLFPLLAWRSLAGSRGAWAFLVALCFTLFLIFSFAAPKLRTLLEINLWTAYIIPGLLAVGWVGLSSLRDQYRERV
jgi:hypothetical protein